MIGSRLREIGKGRSVTPPGLLDRFLLQFRQGIPGTAGSEFGLAADRAGTVGDVSGHDWASAVRPVDALQDELLQLDMECATRNARSWSAPLELAALCRFGPAVRRAG
jgi:hypothetical protein